MVADSPLDGAPTAGYSAEELGVEDKEIQIAARAHMGALLISQIAHMFVYVSPSLDSSIFRTLNLLQVCIISYSILLNSSEMVNHLAKR